MLVYFRPPPLCGAVPAESNYIAEHGDKVAARVKGDDGEENWILAEVVSYHSTSGKYDVDDIDAEEGKTVRFVSCAFAPLLVADTQFFMIVVKYHLNLALRLTFICCLLSSPSNRTAQKQNVKFSA